MKKIGILTIVAMLFIGLMGCEKKAGEDNNNGGEAAKVENNAGTNAATNATTPGNTNAEPASTLPVTTVEFVEDNHNFGEIKAGEKVSHVYKFRNTGANPLKIENVKPSCGCTTPDWSKDEVAPGEEGFVTVEFDSKGKKGIQKKSVTFTFNGDPKNKILNFTGEVVE
ncbi:MAG TPA: DUF1573 domain-containing protein [Bacteroidetes bacterium]|nr:DUF1573 domain-containing protein [Bacteroidota bacterium]